MRRIRRSTKHEHLIVVFDETIAARLFPAWAMGWPGDVTGRAAAEAVVRAARRDGVTPGQHDMLGVVTQFLLDGEPPQARQPVPESEFSPGAA